MKKNEYVEQMKEIKPSEDLINRTITNIENMKRVEKLNKHLSIKKVMAGIVATLSLTVGTVGAYCTITGNTQILEKIGIHLSQKYEENSQKIENENAKNVIEGKGFEAKIETAAVDSANLVLEINLKLNEKYANMQDVNLKAKELRINRPSEGDIIGNLIISEEQNISKLEDGTYKMFKYISVKDSNLAAPTFWNAMFEYEENVDVIIEWDGLYDENDKLLEKASIKDITNVNLTRPDNLVFDDNLVGPIKEISYKNVKAIINSVQSSSFGNIISIDLYEDNIDVDKINDIQKMDFDIKDKQGNNIKVISRTENITFDNYKNDRKFHSLGLEIQLTVDDTNNKDYDIKMVDKGVVKVSKERVQKAHKELVEFYEQGNIEENIANEYEQDEYIIDETNDGEITNEQASYVLSTYKRVKSVGVKDEETTEYLFIDEDTLSDFNIVMISNIDEIATEDVIVLGSYTKDFNNVITINPDEFYEDRLEYKTIVMQDWKFFYTATFTLEKDKITLEKGNQKVYYEKIREE